MGKELILPKNIRQIGDIQGKEKIFLEDYVMTYIKKKEKLEKEGYLGIFLGERQEKEDTVYVFVRGILEVPADMLNNEEETAYREKGGSVSEENREEERRNKKIRKETGIFFSGEGKREAAGEEKKETEEKPKGKRSEKNWMDQMEKEYQEYFPDWSVQGCCVIGVYPTERMRLLLDSLPEAGGLIYHLQEQEETIYQVENGRYRQIKGYFVFYEQNRNMQEYMANVFSSDSVEKEGVSDKAIRSFRKKVKEKGLQKNTSFLKLASSFFVVTVLVIGAIVVNRIDDIRAVRTAVDSGDTTVENEVIYVQDTVGTQVTDGTSGGQAADSVVSSYTVESQAVGFPTGDSSDTGTSVSSSLVDTESSVSVSSSLVDMESSANVSGSLTDAENSGSQGISGAVAELAGSDAFWNDTVLEDADSVQSAVSGNDIVQEASGTESVQNTAAGTGITEDAAGIETVQSAESGIDTASETEAVQEAASIRQTQAAYVIKEGDTLADICNRYYGDLNRLADICEINGIADANMIMPGQKIVLP